MVKVLGDICIQHKKWFKFICKYHEAVYTVCNKKINVNVKVSLVCSKKKNCDPRSEIKVIRLARSPEMVDTRTIQHVSQTGIYEDMPQQNPPRGR